VNDQCGDLKMHTTKDLSNNFHNQFGTIRTLTSTSFKCLRIELVNISSSCLKRGIDGCWHLTFSQTVASHGKQCRSL